MSAAPHKRALKASTIHEDMTKHSIGEDNMPHIRKK